MTFISFIKESYKIHCNLKYFEGFDETIKSILNLDDEVQLYHIFKHYLNLFCFESTSKDKYRYDKENNVATFILYPRLIQNSHYTDFG
ncbi:hypothetical protein MTBBW1_1540015 [Desulfamplus magnetovallimortis]|uniref:Uncharacterized protein n=1 Tax=Desulfamplus magnetovallimortis TaxID=1246637 RepID=A0A1W1H8J5_9BACT|nr:hypothetical protein MTBBW1_1540015 [Desulfamplus magnetovallimortis]